MNDLDDYFKAKYLLDSIGRDPIKQVERLLEENKRLKARLELLETHHLVLRGTKKDARGTTIEARISYEPKTK